MSSYGQQFLSKVIDSGDLSAFTRCGITREHFVTAAEKKAQSITFLVTQIQTGAARHLTPHLQPKIRT